MYLIASGAWVTGCYNHRVVFDYSNFVLLLYMQVSIKDNVAYGPTAAQISTENDIAYVQSTTMSTEDNVAYGHTAPQISTEDDVGYVVTENDYSEIIGGDNQYDYVHV